MPSVNGHTLIDELNAGSREALAQLFQAYYPRLVRYARHFLLDGNAAEDVVQELFVYLWEKRGTLHTRQVSAMLMLAVRNRCINCINRQNNIGQYIRHMDADDTIERLTALDMAAADDAVGYNELRSTLDQALGTLTESQRTAFQLVRLQGLTLREAAGHMGVSISMVDKQVRKAAAKVTEHIRRHYPTHLCLLLLGAFDMLT